MNNTMSVMMPLPRSMKVATMIMAMIMITKKMVTMVKTRLKYNCAHLRLTKESLTVEFANKNV